MDSPVQGPGPQPPPPPAEGDALEEMVYTLSHDLRGPLLNFHGYLRRLRRGCEALVGEADGWGLGGEQRERWDQLRRDKVDTSLEILEQNSRRMEGLINALLSLSRAGREPVVWQRFPAGELVQEVAAELRPTLLDAGITLEIGALPDLWADRTRLALVFRLLLENAVKFRSPSRPGHIWISGSTNGAETLCHVQDNGIGMRAQDLRRVFLPFGRIREVDAPGHGVGLATVQKLMRQLHGRVWIESEHRQGTTVFLALPRGSV